MHSRVSVAGGSFPLRNLPTRSVYLYHSPKVPDSGVNRSSLKYRPEAVGNLFWVCFYILSRWFLMCNIFSIGNSSPDSCSEDNPGAVVSCLNAGPEYFAGGNRGNLAPGPSLCFLSGEPGWTFFQPFIIAFWVGIGTTYRNFTISNLFFLKSKQSYRISWFNVVKTHSRSFFKKVRSVTFPFQESHISMSPHQG